MPMCRKLIALVLTLAAIALAPGAGARPSRTAASERAIWVAARSEVAADPVVYRSTDSAEHWLPANRGLPRYGTDVVQLAADPSTTQIAYARIDIGTVRGGLYKTTDGGQSWQLKKSMKAGTFRTIALDPTRPQVVYLVGRDVFRSPDGGEHWRNLRARWCPGTNLTRCGYGTDAFDFVVIDPRRPKTIYGGGGDLLKSTDGGRTWNLARRKACLGRPDLPRCGPAYAASLALDPRHPGVLYGGADGVYKTTDGGRTWVKLTKLASGRVAALAVDPKHSNVVWVFLDSSRVTAVEKSTDGGRTWMRKTRVPPLEEPFAGLAIDPDSPRTVYVTSVGVLKTSDGGATWQAKNRGLPREPREKFTRQWQWQTKYLPTPKEFEFGLLLHRDLVPLGLLKLDHFDAVAPCDGTYFGIAPAPGDFPVSLDVGPNGTFSYTDNDLYYQDPSGGPPRVWAEGKLTLSGRFASREITGTIRITGPGISYCPGQIDSGPRPFVARCWQNCGQLPPAPPPPIIDALAVP
jgi:photosystem II stability/assembly factor-like uncharacterized protein